MWGRRSERKTTGRRCAGHSSSRIGYVTILYLTNLQFQSKLLFTILVLHVKFMTNKYRVLRIRALASCQMFPFYQKYARLLFFGHRTPQYLMPLVSSLCMGPKSGNKLYYRLRFSPNWTRQPFRHCIYFGSI
jgi:hypothetical protein